MGGGRGGGYGRDSGLVLLHDNLGKLVDAYPITEFGYFGSQGSSSSVRRIYSDDPSATAEHFMKLASEGVGTVDRGQGTKTADYPSDSHFTWRVTSDDGSPVIELNLVSSAHGVKPVQKIHFVKG